MRIFLLTLGALASHYAFAAELTAVVDHTNYNAGSNVLIRLEPAKDATAAIRYAGEESAAASGLTLHGSGYLPLWSVPWQARTGRYEVDLTLPDGRHLRNATSFAVHRQLAKVISVELDKTFYSSGDSVSPRIVVRNVSNQRLEHIQVEFEPYTYPWIAPAPDEPPMWKQVVEKSLTLAPGAQQEFEVKDAAVIQVKEPVVVYYSVVLRDSREPDHIYDLAFAPAAFTTPANVAFPKQYPFLYLYQHLGDMWRSDTYRHFYPPRFVSSAIEFDTAHTLFPADAPLTLSFEIKPPPNAAQWPHASVHVRVMDQSGREVEKKVLPGPAAGKHQMELGARPPGLYTALVSLETASGTALAENRLELATNPLPKSILVFCAHQDDDTAHPALIRAAVENHIPIHFVYLTAGDAGGCDRFYMHSCDAERAMDFGEVRMGEARASLGHLGVAPENLFFLGLPDGGLERIWRYHPTASAPYLSVLLASDHAPYREAAIPNIAYAREPVIAAIKQFIVRFSPSLIVTGHPDERHVDHRTNNWLVVKAMQELLRTGELSRDTQLIVDAVYGPAPAKHAPYHFEKQKFYFSGEAARLGQEATWYYQSQDGNHEQGNIAPLEKLSREEPYPHFRILDWQEHEGWNEQR